MADNVVRKLVIRIDAQGNAGTVLSKTDKATQDLAKSSKNAGKELEKSHKIGGEILAKSGDLVVEMTKGFPLIGKSTQLVVSGIGKMAKGMKLFNKESKTGAKTMGKGGFNPGMLLKKENQNVFNNPQLGQSKSLAGAKGGGGILGGALGGLAMGGLIGAAIGGITALVSAGINHIADAAKMKSDETWEVRRLGFQLGESMLGLEKTAEETYNKWEVSKGEIAKVFNIGAKNLLSPMKMKGIIEPIIANARALGISSESMMGAYGKSASTGSTDVLDLNRSALVNMGYGNKIMGWQNELNSKAAQISASGNNPAVIKALQPRINQINDYILKAVGKRANLNTMGLDEKQSNDFWKQEDEDKAFVDAYWGRKAKDGAAKVNEEWGSIAKKSSNNITNTTFNDNRTYNINNNGDSRAILNDPFASIASGIAGN